MIAAVLFALLSAAPPAAAGSVQPEAVLIGLSDPDGRLSTYLADEKGVKRLGRGLAIPRADGFWLVDVSEGDIESVWARPRSMGTPKFWGQKPPVAKPPRDVLGDAGEDRTCESTNRVRVRFASAAVVSITETGYSDCGEQPVLGGAAHVLRLDRSAPLVGEMHAEVVSVGEIVGKMAEDRFLDAGDAERKENACLAAPHPKLWFIHRADGAWTVSGFQGPAADADAGSCRGAESTFDLEDALPERLFGRHTRVNREKLLQEHPDFVDATASPSGRLVVVLEKAKLVLRVDGKVRASTPVPKTDPHPALVMTEWLTGAKELARVRAEAPRVVGR